MSANKHNGITGIIYETVSGSLYTSNFGGNLIKLSFSVNDGLDKLVKNFAGKYVGLIHNRDAYICIANNNLNTYSEIIHTFYPDEKLEDIKEALGNEKIFLRGIPKLLQSIPYKNVKDLITFETFDKAKFGHILVSVYTDRLYYTTPILNRL